MRLNSNPFTRFILEHGVGYIVLYASVIYLMKRFDVSLWLTIGFSVLVPSVDLWLERSQSSIALIYTKRSLVATSVLVTGLLLGSFILFSGEHLKTVADAQFTTMMIFIIQGLTVGVLLRVLFLAHFARKLGGVQTDIQKFLLMIGASVFVWLYPLAETHAAFASLYLSGCAFGFFAHFFVRNQEHQFAELVRRGQHLLQMYDSSGVPLPPTTSKAIRAYASQKWKSPAVLNAPHNNNEAASLAIVSGSALRMKGEYATALAQIDLVLEKPLRSKRLRTVLLLIRALCLADLGQQKKMYAALTEALKLDKDCLLAKVSYALRRAEELPIKHIGKRKPAFRDETSALGDMWEALKLNEAKIPTELLMSVLEFAVPVTWTFLVDAYAYVLFKHGRHKFSKSLLVQCIHDDPIFSSPYLHLGEWYMYESISALKDSDNSRSEHAIGLAQLCFHIAISLEGKRDSLIKRRSQELLRELNPEN